MTDELASIEQGIVELSVGTMDVQAAESRLVQVAASLFAANGYVTHGGGSPKSADGVDLVARRADDDSVGVIIKCPPHSLTTSDVGQLLGLAEGRAYRQYLLMTNGRLRPEALALVRQAASSSVNVLTLDGLRAWVVGIRNRIERPDGSVVELVRRLSRSLIRLIATDERKLLEVEWRDLERVLAEAFDGLGFAVKLTPPSKDGGKDIILECYERGSCRSYIVEIKHWVSGQAVGKKHVRKFINVVANERHASGLFLSTSGFAGNAFEALAQSELTQVKVGGQRKMAAVCEMYVKAETGLWAPERDLTELLFEGTTTPVATD